MTQTALDIILAKDYLKYMKYVELSEDDKMAYLRLKGLNIVNYIEQLFLRLFDDDIDEFIKRNHLKGDDENDRYMH